MIKFQTLAWAVGGAMFLVVFGASGLPLALPDQDGQQHLGVATCASSVCHGSALERNSTLVLQNEFVTWSRHDRHRNAYNTLLNTDSQRIARKLGLENAHEAQVCLDCHADNVPVELRGTRFDLTDGVGCESCHGGSEEWIASHVLPASKRVEGALAQPYPTSEPKDLARVCLSCHLGTEDKFTTHRIMGAGHPRLSFELVTFLELMPPHWEKDEDYKARKGDSNLVNLWVVGQLMSAQEMLALLDSHLIREEKLVPEIALFDCHACHHAMSEKRWKPFALAKGAEPGSLRINLAPLAFLLPIAEGLLGSPNPEMLQALRALNTAVSESKADFTLALNTLSIELETVRAIAPEVLTEQQRIAMLKAIARNASRGHYRDYSLAEQALMAMNLMLEDSGRWASTRAEIQALFDTLKHEDHYSPESFATAATRLKEVL